VFRIFQILQISLKIFLDDFKAVDNGPVNISARDLGHWYIPDKEIPKFFEKYAAAIRSKSILSIMEKQQSYLG
jgi:hypothetical protein